MNMQNVYLWVLNDWINIDLWAYEGFKLSLTASYLPFSPLPPPGNEDISGQIVVKLEKKKKKTCQTLPLSS